MTRTLAKRPFKKVAVIGSGVMGSGIAAHLANAGIPCLLLDMPSKEGSKSQIVENNLKKALALKPAPFFTPETAALISTGNLEDDIAQLTSCDWIIEVIVENLLAKQALFSKIEPYLGPQTVVSSNTSGLSIEGMLEERSNNFRRHFLVTHFFNPVRYLHLLEVIPGAQTAPEVVERIAFMGESVLGKGIVYGKDTPNFVANRIGVFAMMETMRVMQQENMTLEEIDAVFGPATGRPKSAVFRTADVVGLDTFIHVAQNCFDNLPKDERREVFVTPEFLRKMVEKGWLGQKSGQGFYKKAGADIEVLDYQTLTYRAKQKVRYDSLGAIRFVDNLKEKIKTLVNSQDKAGLLAWNVTAATCIYAANRLGEIADDLTQIDNAMKWGFGWELGPFEMWDAMGLQDTAKRLQAEGISLPPWVQEMLSLGRTSFYSTNSQGEKTYWDPGLKNEKVQTVNSKNVSLTVLKENKAHLVEEGSGANLLDAGDGILVCEFTTKMNAIDGDILNSINKALDLCEEGQFDALVLANDGANFSVGANLLLLYLAAQQKEWAQIDAMVKAFQNVGRRLKYSRIPTIAAPFQLTLGGGTELSLWCNRIRAHAETYMGLVEAGVGLIPGGGGNIRMLYRTLWGAVDDPTFPTEPLIRRALETVAMAKVSTSGEEARKYLYLMPSDGIEMNRQHLLYSAKQEALGMMRAGFKAPREKTLRLPGKSAYATFEMALTAMKEGHMISEHDLKISLQIAHVMTGGDCSPRVPVSEQYLLDLEREAFLSLCGEEKTQARIAYMLENNKPLRN